MRLLILLSLFSVPFFGMAQGSDSCQASGDFTAVQVYNGIQVDLIRSDQNKWCCDTSTNFSDLDFALEEGVLTLRRAPGSDKDKAAIVKIYYTNLKSIAAYNKSTIGTPNLMKTDSVLVTLKTGAIFYGSFDIKYLEADVSEGCLFGADGYAIEQKVIVSLKATFSGFELEGEKGEIKATSGGKAKVNILETLKATATAGGYIGYKSSPKVEEKISLGGKIVNDKD